MEKEKNANIIKFNSSQGEETLKSDKKLIKTSKAPMVDSGEILKYEECPERWYNLVAFCFCSFANGFQWFIFTGISKKFSIQYNISLWKVKIFSMIYLIIYPFTSIFESWIFENYSIKIGLRLCSGFTLLGAFLLVFIICDKTLSVCYIGQIFSALFRPLLLNSPGKISSNWFQEDKRTLITSICCLSDTAGILVGYLWNMAYIKKNSIGQDYKDQVFRYMLSEFILIFFLCIPAFFIDKDKPDKLSSPSQNKNKQKLLNDLRKLFSNLRFIFLLISSFFIVGYYFIIGNIFNDLLNLYKITNHQCTVIFSVSITIGIISSIIFSYFVDKYKKFKLIMIILCISAIIFQVFLTFLLEISKSKELNSFSICFVFYILINGVVIPFYTIGINYSCEITYPVTESLSGGIVMIMSQLCGIGGTYLFNHLIEHKKEQTWIINVIILVFYIISLICTLFFNEKLIRYEIDKNENKIEKEKEVKIDIEIESNRNEPAAVQIKQK